VVGGEGEAVKLRPYPVSLNGNTLEPDQFGFTVDRSGEPIAIQFRCRGPNQPPNSRQCCVDIVRGKPDGYKHGWDGNPEEPTITPSIGCDNAPRCGWHGHIIKGDITP